MWSVCLWASLHTPKAGIPSHRLLPGGHDKRPHRCDRAYPGYCVPWLHFTFFTLWLLGVGRVGTLESDYVTGYLLNLFRCKLVFPGDHSFCRHTYYDNVIDIFEGTSVNPVFIGEVRSDKTLSLRQVAYRAMFVIDFSLLSSRFRN